MSLQCTRDTKYVRCGFLWLSTKVVKIDGLTLGKRYEIMDVRCAEYGNSFINQTFIHFLVRDDNGVPQLHPSSCFGVFGR